MSSYGVGSQVLPTEQQMGQVTQLCKSSWSGKILIFTAVFPGSPRILSGVKAWLLHMEASLSKHIPGLFYLIHWSDLLAPECAKQLELEPCETHPWTNWAGTRSCINRRVGQLMTHQASGRSASKPTPSHASGLGSTKDATVDGAHGKTT